MILSGVQIQAEIEAHEIEIDPFDPAQLNPASYDLTLGDEVVQYNVFSDQILDVKKEWPIHREMIGQDGFIIYPNAGYLMHTRERIYTEHFVPVLDGKSSLGRLFVSIYQTAGYGDPGFNGQYTLEVTTLYPIRLYAGMRIAQMRFHCMDGPVKLYDGQYTGENSKGPVPSRAWRQFR
jgi:dCTP deaminase